MSEERKFAYVFPGQGSQQIGMGEIAYRESSRAREIFAAADSLAQRLRLGIGITDLCFRDPEGMFKFPQLHADKISAAILTASLATMAYLDELGLPPAIAVAGHSAGKITAAVVAGAFDLSTALGIIIPRGQFMADDNTRLDAAVRVLSPGKRGGDRPEALGEFTKVLADLRGSGEDISSVSKTIENNPGQLVYGGVRDSVGVVSDRLAALGHRIVEIDAPLSHHPLLEQAQQRLNGLLDKVSPSAGVLKIPVIDDVDGKVLGTAMSAIASLRKHVDTPISWRRVADTMVSMGVTDFIEMGSGNVLTRLTKMPILKGFSTDTEEKIGELKHHGVVR